MTEQLIQSETAELAKEKRFDWEVNNVLIFNGTRLYEGESLNYNSNSSDVSLPTQSLLQKWLREKHNLHIQINNTVLQNLVTKKYNWAVGFLGQFDFAKIGVKVWEFDDTEDAIKLFYNKYEEALEVALIEALKLVKPPLLGK